MSPDTATTTTTTTGPARRGTSADGNVTFGLGSSAGRPDGIPKVRGEFAFSSDLHRAGMLWGRTLRSPHPHARIVRLDISAALAMPGVAAVVTAADVPGSPTYGLISSDQPVYAADVVRYVGEAVASVAADSVETARRACEAIVVDYEVLEPLVDPERALDPSVAPIHPDGNVVRYLPIRFGELDADDAPIDGPVSVEATYELGMQDQAFLGPESGLAVPADDGSVDLHVSTQFLHVDRDQVADCLGLAPEDVRLHLAGVGGAFGAREDVSFHVHGCLLALRSGRPVKFSYLRDESFLGHVHRHPGRLQLRFTAEPDGTLVSMHGRVVLDGGAYASSSFAVIANAARFLSGPYRFRSATVDAYVTRTNNPPCGAMRGFGAVQACFAHESLMDELAAVLALDPIELRLRNAMRTGDRMITGQRLTGSIPVREVIEACRDLPLPEPPDAPPADPAQRLAWPGGAGRTADHGDLRRGVGFAVGWKNLLFSEGHDDDAWAACVLENGVATLVSACAEVGQGWVTLAQQIGRTLLGTPDVVLEPASTATIGTAGSTSASRQTWMSGGAVELACKAVADQVAARWATAHGLEPSAVTVRGGLLHTASGEAVAVAHALPAERFTATVRHQHAPTFPLDQRTGQGDCDVSFAFVAHRAVVDVDPELGLVRVVHMGTAQDVGAVLNPLQTVGQLEGGIAQGVGLAVMEEIVVEGGLVRNPSFTDYLIPTILDVPVVDLALIEVPEPHAPFGAKGIGEPPTLSSTPAVVAALRAATGRPLRRVPVRPQDIALD